MNLKLEVSENTKSLIPKPSGPLSTEDCELETHALSASMTINITLLNGADTDSDSSLKTDKPGRNGLYGKKPTAKVNMPTIRERLVAAISSHCCLGRIAGKLYVQQARCWWEVVSR